MGTVAGLFYSAALLLAVGGIPKLMDPRPTGRALDAVGLPGSHGVVRVLGGYEVLIGLAGVVLGGAVFGGLIAITYAAFAGFIAYAMANPQRATGCGCFGESEAPPSLWHLVGDIVACVVALAAAALVVPGLGLVLSEQPAGGIPFLGLVGLGTWFAYLAFTLLPDLIPADPGGRA